jgi:hypothetical protein
MMAPEKRGSREMPEYRRNRVAGGTYLFTLALANRRSDLLVRRFVSLPYRRIGCAAFSTCMRYGHCLRATPIFPPDGV